MGRFVKGEKYKYGETLGVLVEATTQEEADVLFAELMEYCVATEPDKSTEELELILRSNLGYYAGYYNIETRKRVEEFYGAIHPIFGSTSSETQMTTEEVFAKGMEMGEQINNEKENKGK